MKKALKISLYCFVLSCIIALALCYIIIPERTKEAMDIVFGYLNTPIGIVGGTTITTGLVSYIVFRLVVAYKTKLIVSKYNEAKLSCEKEKEEAKQYYENAKKEKEEIKEMLTDFKKEIGKQRETLVRVCKTVPNKKVNEIGKSVENYGERKETTNN